MNDQYKVWLYYVVIQAYLKYSYSIIDNVRKYLWKDIKILGYNEFINFKSPHKNWYQHYLILYKEQLK